MSLPETLPTMPADPILANAERKRRADIRNAPPPFTDADRLTGNHGAPVVTGPEFARLNEIGNARSRADEAQKRLTAAMYRHQDSANAYQAYCTTWRTTERLLTELSAMTGESYFLAEMLPDPFLTPKRLIRAATALRKGEPAASAEGWDKIE